MSNVKVSIDKESSEHLDHVKKGKPRRFVMLCKGPKILSLVLFKKGAKSTFIKQAKEAGTGEICFGTVGGKGQELLFYLAKADGFEKEPTTNVKLKEFINEATDGSFKPEFRLVDEAPLVLDEDDPLVKRYLFLKNNLHDVGERSEDEKTRLAELFRQAGSALEEGDEQNAKTKLDDLDKSLMRDESIPEAPKRNDPREAIIQQLNKLKPAIGEVFVKSPERKPELLHLVEECKRRLTAGDLNGAILGLEEIRKFVDDSTPKRQLPLRLGKMAEPIKEALNGPNGKTVERLLSEFKQAQLLDDHATAGVKLDLLAGLLGYVGDQRRESTESWSRKFEFEPESGALKNYISGKELGSGGTGNAKLLHPVKEGGDLLVAKFLNDSVSDRIDLLEVEQQVYEDLGDHPNLPRSLGVRTVDGKPALLLEAVDGPTMADTIVKLNLSLKLGRISAEDYWGAIRYMTLKMLQTLAFMESKNYMHSDIRPTNVMIDSTTGELKVIDLGGSKKIGETLTQGSFDYAPKEAKNNATKTMLENYQTTNKYDIFSSGISVQNSGMMNSGLATEYTKLIKKMLSEDPNDRPTIEQALAMPFFTQGTLDEEQARKVLKRETTPSPEPVVETENIVDKESWDRILKTLVEAKKFDIGRAGVLIKRVSDLYRLLTEPEAAYKKYSREAQWDLKKAALDNAMKYATEAVAAINKLMDISTGAGPTLRTALHRWMEIKQDVGEVLKIGAPVITVKGFASRWRELKSAAEKTFDEIMPKGFHELACKQLGDEFEELTKQNAPQKEIDKVDQASEEVVARRIKQLRAAKEFQSLKSLESFFGFTENFSGALNDFEKVVGKNAKDFAKRRDKALEVAKKYFKAVVERSAFKFGDHPYGNLDDLKSKDGVNGAEMIYKLKMGLNDLIGSVIRIKEG